MPNSTEGYASSQLNSEDAEFVSFVLTVCIILAFSLIICIYNAVAITEPTQALLNDDAMTAPVVHPTWDKTGRICSGAWIMAKKFGNAFLHTIACCFYRRKQSTLPVSGGAGGERSLSVRNPSSVGRYIRDSFRPSVLGAESTEFNNPHKASMNNPVFQQRKMHYLVRKWVTSETDLSDVMGKWNLKFHDIAIEEQFNYYYLYIHSSYIRMLTVVLLLALIAAIPLTTHNLIIRAPIAILLLLSLYFTSTKMMDERFWIADWSLNLIFFFGNISLIIMLAFDVVLAEDKDSSRQRYFKIDVDNFDNNFNIGLIIGSWMIYLASWTLLTGTAWRKQLVFLFISYICICIQIKFRTIRQKDFDDSNDYHVYTSMVVLAVYTILCSLISRSNENNMRQQFYQSWTLLRAKIHQEQLLQKQKFNEEEIEVIRQVMENRNEDIDMELQEVLIDSDDLKLEDLLGKGAYGEVFKANYEGIHVAVKVIKDISENNLERTRAEILLMKGLQHPQIVMFIGACWDEFMMGIVLELVDNGPLANFLHNKKLHLSWEHPKLGMAKDAAAGCAYLHQSTYYDEKEGVYHDCIIHRDLKPDNMLVTTTYGIKLTDFGEARVMDSEMTMTQVGSPVYMAPEVLKGERYDERVDIYSYAITLVEMLVLAESVFEVFEMTYKKLKGEDQALTPLALTRMVALENFRPELPDNIPKTLSALIKDCWSANPNNRPNFEEILERLDGEVHEEIYNTEWENNGVKRGNSSMTGGTVGTLRNKKKIDLGRAARATSPKSPETDRDKLAHDIISEIDEDAGADPEGDDTRGSFRRAPNEDGSPAPPRGGRNQHLRKMMSMKRAALPTGVGLMSAGTGASSRGLGLSKIGGSVRGNNAFGGATAHGSAVTDRKRRNSDLGGGLGALNLAGLSSPIMRVDENESDDSGSDEENNDKGHVRFKVEGEGGDGDKATTIMNQKNELAKVKAALAALQKDMEKMKRELEETKAAAQTSQTQLKLAQKNARQARMDMNERKRQSMTTAIKTKQSTMGEGKLNTTLQSFGEEDNDAGMIEALEAKLADSQKAILKKEAELDYYRKKKSDGSPKGETGKKEVGNSSKLAKSGTQPPSSWNPLAGVMGGGRKKSISSVGSGAGKGGERSTREKPKDIAAGIAASKKSVEKVIPPVAEGRKFIMSD
ncbi:hypothetical protein TL16_g01562 [Triparma laevis f. inornata]|uniref:Protein kinase domain-containing protein n=1 Tax=Triparma laevis f. inornata TaxID=1714386 RepID=A0A9W7DSY2_9STRA|nr:hypothetical protein TL16_g01562 [Triparma laevis f. inornata]